jgi:hypothetical protein
MKSNTVKVRFSMVHTFSIMKLLKEKIFNKIRSRYGINIEMGIISISGLNNIKINNLKFVDNRRNIACSVDSVAMKIRWRSVLTGKLRLTSLQLMNCSVIMDKRAVPDETTATGGTQAASPQDIIRKFYRRVAGRIDILFELLPAQVKVENLELILSSRRNIQVAIGTLSLQKQHHTARGMQAVQPDTTDIPRQLVEQKQLMIGLHDCTVATNRHADGPTSAINTRQLSFTLNCSKGTAADVWYDVYTQAKDLASDNDSASDQHAIRCELGLNLYMQLNTNGFHIDRQSCLSYNDLKFPIYMDHFYKEHDIIEVGLQLLPVRMEDILKCFRNFNTKSLYSNAYAGTLSLLSRLRLELTSSFKREFEIKLDNNLRILEHGGNDYSYLKWPFVHTVYDDGIPVRAISLDVANPAFLALNQISPYLRKVVVCTEDPHYYHHKGIDPEAIFLALATNIKSRKLDRGASTITMQVARNLFLHHRKNFQRKIEEVILTWYLEEVFPLGKDRILEIYLNIIELGPGVYGVEEAARFYFGKSASQLSLTEALTMSYIIPRPKFFLEALDMKSSRLIKKLKAHIKYHSNMMLKKELITMEDLQTVQYKIVFPPLFQELDLAAAATADVGN